ncbi:hypothetical protein BJF92_06405 [Rhizobium rhizosphaerae]|uniref:T6SS Phospholipase effector Tle1-like catalytic domain-containing protein n=1 Tax=Xaviernesmea rhizosphaerae TaxID=1672749 RepID=A0A1Q9AP10_9HYPH|nr:DUF2235 domain-containing protein [Xaviernesmea rhizosphaerae]OLP57156.1 hypothetical protein BJF92_06405 [Xaviernesmea rhizosphaerae]
MAKNIVILFDGTSNEISADRTNVLRLFGILERNDRQLVYYDPGVGTFGADNAWSKRTRQAAEIWGLATGWGLDENVKEAYRMLVDVYDPGQPDEAGHHPDPDRIFLFGFSRGAYTARVLAGFINAFGLTKKIHLNLLDYAYRAYKSIPVEEQESDDISAEGPAPSAFRTMRLYERTLRNIRPPIKLLGLFDTVASVIEMGKWLPQTRSHPFTHHNPSVEVVRHAVAIDERRTMFQPELWRAGQDYYGGPFTPKLGETKPQNFKEVWFAGVHGDIGGGYPESESAAIKIPLQWMIEETRGLGLEFNTGTIATLILGEGEDGKGYERPCALARLHNSMNVGWKLLEFVPRKVPMSSWRNEALKKSSYYIPLEDRRYIAPNAFIHRSVERRIKDTHYAPPNLPKQPNFVD